jgi:hypothetical protein
MRIAIFVAVVAAHVLIFLLLPSWRRAPQRPLDEEVAVTPVFLPPLVPEVRRQIVPGSEWQAPLLYRSAVQGPPVDRVGREPLMQARTAPSSSALGSSVGGRSSAEQSAGEQYRPEQSALEQPAAEQTPAEQTRAEQTRAEQTRAEQTRAEQTRAEQTPAEQTPAEQTPAEQTRAVQTGVEHSSAEQSQVARQPWISDGAALSSKRADWHAEAHRLAGQEAARIVAAEDAAERRANALTAHFKPLPPPRVAGPQFGWDYASTHRFTNLPGGGFVYAINDNCQILIFIVPFIGCTIGKQPVNGDLFKNLHPPVKYEDWDWRVGDP